MEETGLWMGWEERRIRIRRLNMRRATKVDQISEDIRVAQIRSDKIGSCSIPIDIKIMSIRLDSIISEI